MVGNPKITESELDCIIEDCELTELIHYYHDKSIGENGSKLSGGERKRVQLARTLADFEASIYIFDEISSSLDVSTFERIFDRIEIRLANKMRIYIEHNPIIRSKVNETIDIVEYTAYNLKDKLLNS